MTGGQEKETGSSRKEARRLRAGVNFLRVRECLCAILRDGRIAEMEGGQIVPEDA